MQSDPDTDDDEIFDEYRWNLLYRKQQEKRVAEAVRLFRGHGIEPILFKGWALSPFYPESKARVASDVDLAVSNDEYPKAVALLDSIGPQRAFIDLHQQFRHHDLVDWNDLFANCQTIDADGESVRILRPEDHLRVLCVHWLTDGGEYREKLWDIFFVVTNRGKNFDWDRCLSVISRVRRRWIECTLGLTARYLALDLEDTPLAGAADRLPLWLVKSVEKSWANEVRLQPLHAHVDSTKKFAQQLMRRFPPNPIHATVMCEGSFDAATRLHYQARNLASRLWPSLGRIGRQIRPRTDNV